jgi:hypothetical protein
MKNDWKEEGSCYRYDTNLFFEKYEEDILLRSAIDKLCNDCPLVRHCFAVGISQKEWGVWGGVYLENGGISKEFSKHRTKAQWAEKWKNLTMDN